MQATLLQLDASSACRCAAGRCGARTRRRASAVQPQAGRRAAGRARHMLQYPYRCFEQVTSRSIALHDKAMWQAAVESCRPIWMAMAWSNISR
jgi:hypothetical protein